MPPPTEQQQIEILLKLQRLVTDDAPALKSASYKFALLHALANVAVERGDDSGTAMAVPLDVIAEKFIALYWRQALPYAAKTTSSPPVGANNVTKKSTTVLLQNRGIQAAIINAILREHEAVGSLAALQADRVRWRKLVGAVRATVVQQPLWKLQVVGRSADDFLYANTGGTAASIDLKPGVVFTLRRFHGLVQELVRGAWTRFVSSLDDNRDVLGTTQDLHDFLFGTDRASLEAYRGILVDVQKDQCFYCETRLSGKGHVDHFIPWSRYPVDLGHNFVLAHAECNGDKSNLLAAVDHLERWVSRNREHGAALDAEFVRKKLVADLGASRAVTRWAYDLAARSGSQLWIARGKPLVGVRENWSDVLGA